MSSSIVTVADEGRSGFAARTSPYTQVWIPNVSTVSESPVEPRLPAAGHRLRGAILEMHGSFHPSVRVYPHGGRVLQFW
jgi:hypothetical protein